VFAAGLDHGISPSQAVTRYVAAAGHTVPASVAAGVLTYGDHHGGAGEGTAQILDDALRAREDESLETIAEEIVRNHLDRGERIPGFGHPMHRSGDPRTPLLFRLAREHGVADDGVELLEHIETQLIEQTGDKRLKANLDGSAAAILYDLGFDPEFARVRGLISRTPALIAHSKEEREREPWWRAPAGDFKYDGPENRTLEEDS
jgi:citrate synthase/citryl-CoA lyase